MACQLGGWPLQHTHSSQGQHGAALGWTINVSALLVVMPCAYLEVCCMHFSSASTLRHNRQHCYQHGRPEQQQYYCGVIVAALLSRMTCLKKLCLGSAAALCVLIRGSSCICSNKLVGLCVACVSACAAACCAAGMCYCTLVGLPGCFSLGLLVLNVGHRHASSMW